MYLYASFPLTLHSCVSKANKVKMYHSSSSCQSKAALLHSLSRSPGSLPVGQMLHTVTNDTRCHLCRPAGLRVRFSLSPGMVLSTLALTTSF